MKKIGLFFGSFNPIHIGHLAIANYMLSFTHLEELWFIVSPQNPLKSKENLLAEHHRYEMVKRAIIHTKKMKVSDVELKMPKPSFTINTMKTIRSKYPSVEFFIIIGADNLNHIHKWKNAEKLLENNSFLVYPRHKFSFTKDLLPPALKSFTTSFNFINAPKIEITSSFIRKAIREDKFVRFFLTEKVYQYLMEMNFYKN